jgi:hypothetical protein
MKQFGHKDFSRSIDLESLLPLMMISALMIYCTNPFSTRQDQVEKPDFRNDGSNVSYDTAVDPEMVFTNFGKALVYKNVDEYMKCFVNTANDPPYPYYFEPERYYKNEFNNQPWLLTDEREYFTQLTKSQKNDYPQLELSILDSSLAFLPLNPLSINDSVETGNLHYHLTINFDADSTAIYEGAARFKLYHSESAPETWHIYYWQDYALNNRYNVTWTNLKLSIRKK